MNFTENYEDIFELPVIPLRGLVVFPQMVLHFDVGRKKSVSALKNAMQSNQRVFLVCQEDAVVDEPTFDDLYKTGVVCSIKQMVRIPNSENLRVVVEGIERGELLSITQAKPFLRASIGTLSDIVSEHKHDLEQAYIRAVLLDFEHYATLMPKISNDVRAKVLSIEDCGKLADFICSNTFMDYHEKQLILSECDSFKRISQLLVSLKKEIAALEIEAEIQEKVQNEIEKNQREYYLREEMKVIADSLGDGENPIEEADSYREQIFALKCDERIKEKLYKECDKLAKMPANSHEGTVVRNYLDKCLEIPFGTYTKENVNLQKAKKILDKDHFGLEKVKERVVDLLAVYKRNPDFKGQILCLAGPPGVGKTSIVKSLAVCMNRKYVRIALGGIHDEAEIRGHRKTYIGAMTGKIVDAVIKSGVMNPVILLDEIDKVGNDYKGDPSSALLEALDPEQNSTFTDHYIDFPIDLSRVMFITTANDTSAISAPLYDRMEIIELNSYTVLEKFHIAKNHLLKREMKKHSLNAREFKISDDALYSIIEGYTREAGVRKLQTQLAAVCRSAVTMLESGSKSVKVTEKNIEQFLGKRKFLDDKISKKNLIGTVNGLAWTSVGGALLPIEVSVLDGTGKIELTGNLGDVMKESAKTAVSYIRSISKSFDIESEFYKSKDIHIHAPEGAVPKDGPSAGLAITTALLSELTGVAIKSNVAMTGEISLKGKAMAIGGLKEKSMAAYKAGCDVVIIPKDNVKDLSEISDEVKSSVEFVSVSSFTELIPIAFEASIPRTEGVNKPVISANCTSQQQAITQ